mgnify:CR=1 FL=1
MRSAVITGAASGLGRELAIALAKRGYQVLIADINQAGMEKTLALVRQNGGQGEVYTCDVSNPAEVQRMADYAFSAGKRVDLLINNAGVVTVGHVGDISLDDWQWCVGINFWGMLHGCHSFIPGLKAQGGGHIINIASSAGLFSLMQMGPYNVTKAAVISLSETLRTELAAYNIGVTVSCPMFFHTNLLDTMRYRDRFQHEFAHAAFDHGRMNAREVAERTVKAFEKNRLYVIPQWTGRMYWVLKRLAPSLFYDTMAFAIRKGFGEKAALLMTRAGLM